MRKWIKRVDDTNKNLLKIKNNMTSKSFDSIVYLEL